MTPETVLAFWIDETGPDRWYEVDPALDDAIRARFLPAWEAAAEGRFAEWRAAPAGALALLILLDQFPRNMFRGDARAFATDARALAAAKEALDRGLDAGVEGDARQFFYLPLMHSEILADQERSVRRFLFWRPEGDELRHARAHRLVIRRFGRFPYRNAALGRRSTPAETAFLEAGGYAAALAELG